MALATMAYYSISLFLMAAFYALLRWLAYDRKSCFILLSAAAVYTAFFFLSNNQEYGVDAGLYMEYITYIAQHGAIPSPNFNDGTRHPPAYFIIAALFYVLGKQFENPAPLAYAYYASLLCYYVYIAIAGLLLRDQLPTKSRAYYGCLALLAFWPVGITKTVVLHCDLLLYPAEMAVIYCAVRWQRAWQLRWLEYAFYAAAIAILAKNNAIVLVISCFFMLALHLWHHRKVRELPWAAIMRLLLAIMLVCLCSYLTLSRDSIAHVGTTLRNPVGRYSWLELVWMYLYFNPYQFIINTYVTIATDEPNYHFWHFFLNSLQTGNFPWRYDGLVFPLHALWLAMLAYILHGFWRTSVIPSHERGAVRVILCFGALLVAMLMYAFYTIPPGYPSADARYIYPIIAIVITCYGKVMSWHDQAGHETWSRAGNAISVGLVVLSAALILLPLLIDQVRIIYGLY